MGCYKLLDGGNHILQHFFRHARIDTDPEGIGHHKIRILQFTDNAETFTCSTHLIECWMLHQITGKEVTGLYPLAFQIFTELVTGKTGIGFY